jgi:hypothetical protein
VVLIRVDERIGVSMLTLFIILNQRSRASHASVRAL